jgi:hypothetical protein
MCSGAINGKDTEYILSTASSMMIRLLLTLVISTDLIIGSTGFIFFLLHHKLYAFAGCATARGHSESLMFGGQVDSRNWE